MTSLVVLLTAALASAQVRGRGRIQGTVLDQSTGKPIAGATITLADDAGKASPMTVRTDGKGKWAALGLIGGTWNIDVAAPGYQTTHGTVQLGELQMIPPIKTELAPEVRQEIAPAEVAPSIPKEVVDAVRLGEDLMRQEKYKEASAEFEKALSRLAGNVDLEKALAQAYYKSGELKKAIEILEKLTAVDPFAPPPETPMTGVQLLLVNLYLEDGQMDKGKSLLEKIPASEITDPLIYVNFGILSLNKNKAADAVPYLTRALELDPKLAESYYYRGLAYVQMKKNSEAKADFEQVLALAPDSAEARDARQLLGSLK